MPPTCWDFPWRRPSATGPTRVPGFTAKFSGRDRERNGLLSPSLSSKGGEGEPRLVWISRLRLDDGFGWPDARPKPQPREGADGDNQSGQPEADDEGLGLDDVE